MAINNEHPSDLHANANANAANLNINNDDAMSQTSANTNLTSMTNVTLELRKAAKKTIRHAKNRRAVHAMIPLEAKEALLCEEFPHVKSAEYKSHLNREGGGYAQARPQHQQQEEEQEHQQSSRSVDCSMIAEQSVISESNDNESSNMMLLLDQLEQQSSCASAGPLDRPVYGDQQQSGYSHRQAEVGGEEGQQQQQPSHEYQEVDNDNHIDYNNCIQTLTPAEMSHLQSSMYSYEKQRVTYMMEQLCTQMSEFHQLLEENDALKHQLTDVTTQKKAIETIKDEKISELEGQIVEMKLNLAMHQSRQDHHKMSMTKLELDLKRSQEKNERLVEKLDLVAKLDSINYKNEAVVDKCEHEGQCDEPSSSNNKASRRKSCPLTRSLSSAEKHPHNVRTCEPAPRKNLLLTRSWFGRGSGNEGIGGGLGSSFLDKSVGRGGSGSSFLDRSGRTARTGNGCARAVSDHDNNGGESENNSGSSAGLGTSLRNLLDGSNIGVGGQRSPRSSGDSSSKATPTGEGRSLRQSSSGRMSPIKSDRDNEEADFMVTVQTLKHKGVDDDEQQLSHRQSRRTPSKARGDSRGKHRDSSQSGRRSLKSPKDGRSDKQSKKKQQESPRMQSSSSPRRQSSKARVTTTRSRSFVDPKKAREKAAAEAAAAKEAHFMPWNSSEKSDDEGIIDCTLNNGPANAASAAVVAARRSSSSRNAIKKCHSFVAEPIKVRSKARNAQGLLGGPLGADISFHSEQRNNAHGSRDTILSNITDITFDDGNNTAAAGMKESEDDFIKKALLKAGLLGDDNRYALLKAGLLGDDDNNTNKNGVDSRQGSMDYSTLVEFEPAMPQLQRALSLHGVGSEGQTHQQQHPPSQSQSGSKSFFDENRKVDGAPVGLHEKAMSLRKAMSANRDGMMMDKRVDTSCDMPQQHKAASLRGRRTPRRNSRGDAYLAFC